MNPEIVSDVWNGGHFDAAEALIDYIVDDSKVKPRNFWSGKNNKEATFVYDIGCEVKVTEIHLRNSHGGKGNNRCKHIIFTRAREIMFSLFYPINFNGVK